MAIKNYIIKLKDKDYRLFIVCKLSPYLPEFIHGIFNSQFFAPIKGGKFICFPRSQF